MNLESYVTDGKEFLLQLFIYLSVERPSFSEQVRR